MNAPYNILVFTATLLACIVAKEDLDFVDTEVGEDRERDLKCDACTIVTSKFVEAFSVLQGEVKPSVGIPPDDDIINAAESVCDDAWKGYGLKLVDGREKLTTRNEDKDLSEEEEALWSRRLQDMCDELLGEASDEKTLYNIWANENSLEDYMCRGEGTFGACSSDDWGPWPGDDYEDYDDHSDFDIHDEF